METEDSGSADERLPEMLSPEFFKAMSDPTRITILWHLSTACALRSVSQIAERVPVDLSVVSRHLRTLQRIGILKSYKTGKEVYYGVDSRNLVRTLRALADAFEKCCPNGCSLDKAALRDGEQSASAETRSHVPD